MTIASLSKENAAPMDFLLSEADSGAGAKPTGEAEAHTIARDDSSLLDAY